MANLANTLAINRQTSSETMPGRSRSCSLISLEALRTILEILLYELQMRAFLHRQMIWPSMGLDRCTFRTLTLLKYLPATSTKPWKSLAFLSNRILQVVTFWVDNTHLSLFHTQRKNAAHLKPHSWKEHWEVAGQT